MKWDKAHSPTMQEASVQGHQRAVLGIETQGSTTPFTSVVFHLKSRLPSVTTFDRVYLQNPGRNPPELLALLLLLLPSVQTITKLLLLL